MISGVWPMALADYSRPLVAAQILSFNDSFWPILFAKKSCLFGVDEFSPDRSAVNFGEDASSNDGR